MSTQLFDDSLCLPQLIFEAERSLSLGVQTSGFIPESGLGCGQDCLSLTASAAVDANGNRSERSELSS